MRKHPELRITVNKIQQYAYLQLVNMRKNADLQMNKMQQYSCLRITNMRQFAEIRIQLIRHYADLQLKEHVLIYILERRASMLNIT